MRRAAAFLYAVLAVTTATFLFWLIVHQISALWLGVALRPELEEALTHHRSDQLLLRRLDPARAGDYRHEFEKAHDLLTRIEILRLGEARMLRRFEAVLVSTFALAASVSAFGLLLRHRRAEASERSAFAARVAALQETARRQAHEIKGPLTAARMELERCFDLLESSSDPADVRRALESIGEEMERLEKSLRGFASFAGIGRPAMRRESLDRIVEDFRLTFDGAWGSMSIVQEGREADVCADRDMVRQVLINLCSNSATAGAKTITMIIQGGSHPALTVKDDGCGIAPSLGDRIFDPYVTTQKAPGSVGLGLAISRKIMLDHGGDLKLVRSDEGGATFTVQFGDVSLCANESDERGERWN
jgi:signal transduction histidine kinase